MTDASGIKYPLARFQDEKITQILTGVSGSYSNNSIIGTKLTFPNVAANNGWSGSITGAAIHFNNTILATDSLSLLLFGTDIIVSSINATNLSTLNLSESDTDNYLGVIALSNSIQLSERTLFSSNALNFKYTCVAQTISAILILNSASTRNLSSARIATTLQINKS